MLFLSLTNQFTLFSRKLSSALGKAHMRSTPSLRRFPNVIFETVLMFILLTMSLSRPFKE